MLPITTIIGFTVHSVWSQQLTQQQDVIFFKKLNVEVPSSRHLPPGLAAAAAANDSAANGPCFSARLASCLLSF